MAYDPTDDLNRIPAPGSSSESDADLAQIPAPTAAPEPPKQTFGDLGKRFAAGLADTFLTAPGAITESLGGSGIARRSGQELSKRITDTLSPQAQALDQNALFGEDWSVHPQWGQKIAAGVAQSAPSLIQAFALGRQLQVPLTQAGVAEKVAAGMGRIGVPAGAAKYVGQAVEALPFSAIEGAASGGQSAADVIRQVEEAPIEQLMTVPRFNELFAATNPALSPEERAAAVRAQMAVEAGRSVGAKTGLWTGAVGAVTEGGALGPIARRLSGKGVGEGFFREAIKGGLHEAGQEAPQSAGEQYLSNVGRRDYVDPAQDPWQNVWQAGAEGGVIGFALGGGADAATYRPRPRDEQPHGAAPPGTAPVAPPGAPPVNPPVGPNAGPISRAVQVGQQSGAIPTNVIGGPVDTPGNEEVTQPPGSMSKSLLGVAPSEASSDEKTSALSAIADIAAKVPVDAPLAPDSPVGQAMAGAIERATAAGATQEDLLAAAAGRVPPPDIRPSPKEVKAATKELDAAIDRVGKLTEKIARANAAADKARERGDEETAGNAESLAATLRDRLETARGQLESLQGAQRAGTGSGPVPGTDVGTGVLPADGRPRGGGDQPGRTDAGGSVAAAGVPAGRPAGEGAGLATAAVPPGDARGAGAVDDLDAVKQAARAANTFTGQAPDAGRRVGYTQPRGTPVDQLFANFADTAGDLKRVDAFRERMFERANKDPRRFDKEAVQSAAEPFDGSNSVRLDVTAGGQVRAQVLDPSGQVVAAARIAKGMIDAIAVRPRAAGQTIGRRLLAYLDGQGIANVDEVPDRSPGFVAIQREVIAGRAAPATADQAARGAATPKSRGKPARRTREQAAAARKRAYRDANPFRAFLGEFGVHTSERSDAGGDPRKPVMVPYHGAMFRNSGMRLDELARRAVEAGFLTQADIDSEFDNGGVNKLADMIRRELAGERIMPVSDVESEQEAQWRADMDARYEAMQEAEDAIVEQASDDEINALLQLASDEDAEASNEEIDYIAGQERLGGETQESAAGVAPRGDSAGGAASRPDGSREVGFDLTAPTPDQVRHQVTLSEQEAAGERTQTEDEKRARLDREREAADQVGFLRPPPSGTEQRDTTGDMLGGPTADDVLAQRERERRNAPEAGGMFAAPVDEAAAQAATSPKNDTPEPTEAQKDAGNYKKGHVRVAGLDITIENEAGTHRRPEWPALPAHYGYLKRTEGADGDQVDVFVKPGAPEDFAGDVFVIDQMVGGKFDEHKVMLGYPNQPAAAKAYRDAYTKDWKGLGAIRRMTLNEFKTWLADGDTTVPAAQPAEAASATKERVPPEKKAESKRDATSIARDIAKERPFDDAMQVRAAAREAIREQLGQKALDDMGQGSMMTSDELTQAVHDGQYEGIAAIGRSMPVPVTESQIGAELSDRAFAGTSHSPERRGQSARREYVIRMVEAWTEAKQAAGDDAEALARITDEFERLRDGYLSRYRAYLGAHSNVQSSMIAGPARFPVERNRKRSETADKRAEDANEFLRKGIERLKKAARAPIDQSPASEVERIRKSLAERERAQEQMKAVNAALRKGDDAVLREMGFTDEAIAQFKKPDFAGRTGFPSYRLTNNQAEIRRLRELLEQAEGRVEAAAKGSTSEIVNGVRIEEDAQANRIRLIFEGKPDEATRTALKAAGFRWAPSVGAWQRQLTGNARAAARSIVGRLTAGEPQAQYSVHEEAPAQAQLDLPLAPRDDTVAGRSSPGRRVSNRARASAAVRLETTPDPAGVYHARTDLVAERHHTLPVDRVTTPQEAALALASVADYAVEHLHGLVTDKDGKPLALVGMFKGGLTSSSVYPDTLANEAFRIKGAANLWVTHNHPGGVADFSYSDRNLIRAMLGLFQDTGITLHGLFAQTYTNASRSPGAWVFTQDGQQDERGQVTPADIRAAAKSTTIPVVERVITKFDPAVAISDPKTGIAAATSIQQALGAKQPFVMFLSSQNAVVGAYPLNAAEIDVLRKGERAANLFRAVSMANAGKAIIVDPTHMIPRKDIENVGGALAAAGASTLDYLRPSSGRGLLMSEASAGTWNAPGPIFFSRRNGLPHPGNGYVAAAQRTERDVARLAAAIARTWANGPEVVVVQDMQDMRIPEAVRREDARQRSGGASGEPEGFFHGGKVYLVAGQLGSPADVVRVLAHEALGHYGLRGLYGERLGKILDQIANVRRAEVTRKAQEYGLDARTVEGRRAATEEILAEMAQKNPQMGFVKKAIAAIRQWLRELGFRFAVTDADIIAQFILPARAFVERGARGATDGVAFQRVWHGTPHVFDKFSTDAVGTGEGAQAYGWGLYFASLRDIAEHYRKALSSGYAPRVIKDGVELSSAAEIAEAFYKIGRVFRDYRGIDKVLDFDRQGKYGWSVKVQELDADGNPKYGSRPRWHSTFPNFKDLEHTLTADGYTIRKGSLYEVEIPEDDEFLLWDKTWSDQPASVRDALGSASSVLTLVQEFGDNRLDGRGIYKALSANATAAIHHGTRSFADVAAFGKTGDEAASKYLLSLGIAGIKYLDSSSRNVSTIVVDSSGNQANLQGERSAESFINGFDSLDEAIAEADRQARDYQNMQHIAGVLRGWKAKGYALKERKGTFNYVVFDDSRTKITAAFSRRADVTPLGFYSELARKVEAGPGRADAANWKSFIRSQKGIKPDEIAWSGIEEFLDLQPGKITKEAVREFLAGNGVKVEEVVLGNDVVPPGAEPELTADQIEIIEDAEDAEFWTADAPTGNRLIGKKHYPTKEAAREFALRYFNGHIKERNRERAASAGITPKFADHRVPGQSENYRELLLTLPEPPKKTVFTLYEGGNYFGQYATRKEAEAAKVSERRPTAMVTEIRAPEDGSVFRSGHWDQPNVLAHVRIDERTDADGKRVLFINEIQSDWAQRGRKHGFKTADRLIDGHDYDWWSREADRLMSAKPFDRDAAMRAAENRNALAGHPDEVARAPFVENTSAWVALALKRAIRYALDNGFDRVAIVSGEQAAKMFNLSEHVTRLYYDRDGRGYILSADGRRGEVFPRDMQYSDEELDGVVGKEIAQKIRNREGREDDENGGMILEGVDLEVGGEGMEKFYPRSDLGPVGTDKNGKPIYPIVQLVAQKVLKQIGGPALTTVQMPVPGGTGRTMEVDRGPSFGGRQTIRIADELPMAQPGFDITPAMRDTVLDQGLAMFSRRPSAGDVQRAANQAARAIRGATVKGTWRRMVNAWTDKKPLALQLLGRRQIVDVYGNLLPHLGRYSDEMQQYDADKNESAAVADELVNRWRKLADADALADLMHDATLAQFDPDIEQAGDADQQALKDRFDGLGAEAKSVYREARGAYAAHWNKVKAAIRARIERADLGENERRMMMEQFRDQFLQPIQGVYFPLARWGDYVITAKDADGQRVVVFAESLTEAQAERARMERELTDVSKITLRREYNAARDAVSKEFVRKLFETVDETSADMAEADLLKDAINQLYLTSLPDVSWAKHGIHRKGTPGYSRDARRAFAMNMFHGGYYLSKLRHADVLQDYLRAMQEHIEAQREDAGYDSITAQQVVNEMVKRHDLVMNPDNSVIANTLTGMGFVWFLGLSPASAIVNLSQTALVAYPIMAARFGYGKAADALTRASKEAVQFRNDLRGRYGAEENAAIDRAVREGLIDITQAHDLAGVSEGRDNQLLGALSPVMRAASYLFHQAEKFNRQATFIAVYRLARQAGEGAEQAYDTARDLTYKGHFDYACVDAETECLTLDGWKRYNELREGDVAIAVDANGRAVESRVSAVNIHRGAIPVTKFQSRQFSMVLTDNHDAVVQTYNSRDRKWQAIRKVRADSLKPSQHILRAPSAAIVRTAPKYGEDFAALLGWVAAEGWYAKYRKSKVAHDVRLAQSLSHNPEYVDEIRGILDRLGGEYKEYVSEKRQMVFFVLRRSLGVRVQAAMPDKLLTAAMLRDMPAGEMGALVDAFLKGDGSNRGRGDWSVGQKDGQNLDVIQAMAVMLGMRASQSPVDKQGRGMLHLGRPEAGHRSHVRPMSKERAVVDMVWCPTTEHGTWVARRGGRVFVTGNSSNRPRVMMGPVARVLLLFKQYGQNMIYTLGRNALLWAKGDREAKRALSGILVAHGLTAGMLGLPFAPVLLGLASIIGGSDDEPWDAEVALRNYLADSFLGKTGGEMLARGVFRGFFPGDISGRVGLDSLLIRDIDLTLEPNQVWREILEAALGPVIGIGVNASRGAADLARGDLMLGIQGMLPKAIADGVKTIRYATEGVKDRTGIEVLDEVTARDLVAQTLGFSPGRVREAYDARRAVYGQKRKLDDRRDELLSAFSKSVIAQDHETRLKTLQEIQHFNQINPTMAITSQSMLRSVQNRMRRQAQAKDGIYLPRKQRDLAELGRFANTR